MVNIETKHKLAFLIIAGVLAMIIVSVYIAIKKEPYSDGYEKELTMFKSMGADEQAEYLHLTREEKISKYSASL